MPLQNCSCKTFWSTLIVGLVVVAAIVTGVVLSLKRKEILGSSPAQWNGIGTTKDLQEIVQGRCFNFIAAANPEFKLHQRNIDCFEVWQQLKNAFVYKDPCSMTEENYRPLMELASHFIPCNKMLFWSKTKDLVHRFTKVNDDFLTLEDTLLGNIADELSWCGDLASPGINYQSCPKRSDCENNPTTIYWKMASKMFAEAACGTVQVMLNGSLATGAFRNDSFFGGVEVPNLNPDKITKMHIWLMYDLDGPQSETCAGPSIKNLINILTSRQIKVSCVQNYRPVQLLQCVNNPDHNTCKLCPSTQ